MPFKTLHKRCSLAPTYRETLTFLLLPLTQQEEPWLFCCSIRATPPASQLGVLPMRWGSTVRRPQARAGRNPWPLGQLKAFLWPNVKCTNSSGSPASAQGSHKRVFHLCFKVAGEGCNPGTCQLPTAIFRCFSELAFQVLSASWGRWETRARRAGQTTAQEEDLPALASSVWGCLYAQQGQPSAPHLRVTPAACSALPMWVL